MHACGRRHHEAQATYICARNVRTWRIHRVVYMHAIICADVQPYVHISALYVHMHGVLIMQLKENPAEYAKWAVANVTKIVGG